MRERERGGGEGGEREREREEYKGVRERGVKHECRQEEEV